MDREERVLLSWLPDTQRLTLRDSMATHGYIGLEFSPGADMGRHAVVYNVPELSPHLTL